MLKLKNLLVISLLSLVSINANAGANCTGKFPNFVTDVCWSCTFPLKFFGSASFDMGQEDTNTLGGQLICNCGLELGIPLSFWEPLRLVDVVRAPYCLTNLGGVQPEVGPNGNQDGGFTKRDDQVSDNGGGVVLGMDTSFWHVHWYINPLMGVMDLITETKCLENKGFDIAYLSEIDPTHDDQDLENLLTPDAFLFGNVLAQTACSADCVSSTAGFGSNTLFWCAGCNGGLYPLSGMVKSHVGNIQATSLMMQRVAAKLHRAGSQWAATGSGAFCGYYPQIIMDKKNYKYSVLNPVPQTEKISGRCCQPMGRTTTVFGANKDIPGKENFGYLIYRKRDCCQTSPVKP